MCFTVCGTQLFTATDKDYEQEHFLSIADVRCTQHTHTHTHTHCTFGG